MANKPIQKLKLNGIEIAVWEKETEEGKKLYSYSIQKSYKKADGEYANTNFLNKADLAILAVLCIKLATENTSTNTSGNTTAGKNADTNADATANDNTSEDVPF